MVGTTGSGYAADHTQSIAEVVSGLSLAPPRCRKEQVARLAAEFEKPLLNVENDEAHLCGTG